MQLCRRPFPVHANLGGLRRYLEILGQQNKVQMSIAQSHQNIFSSSVREHLMQVPLQVWKPAATAVTLHLQTVTIHPQELKTHLVWTSHWILISWILRHQLNLGGQV